MFLVGDYVPQTCRVRLEMPDDDVVLANLEAPVITPGVRLAPSLKAGPSLHNDELGTTSRNFVFNLANNHMMDYGREGLVATKETLSALSIPFCGAGEDLAAARKPVVVEEQGKKIGIIGCCERQFGCADIATPGCAEKGFWLFDAIASLKKDCDFVVVSCHAALEHVPLPSPQLRAFYQQLVEAGADVIHGHHAHVPQGWERYRDGVIFYGLGNFVVDVGGWPGRNHRWSLVAQVDFSGAAPDVKIIPFGVSSAGSGEILTAPLRGEDLAFAEGYLAYWNGVFESEARHRGAWQAICVALFDQLYAPLLKAPRYAESAPLSRRNRLRYLYDGLMALGAAVCGRRPTNVRLQRDGRALLNFFWCPSHVEAISTALAVESGAEPDFRTSADRETWTRLGLNAIG